MMFFSILLIGVGLAMDAFAVSLSCGLSSQRKLSNAFILAGSFSFFQMLMPVLGWVLGNELGRFISAYDHWIAFALLVIIGARMVYESFKHGKCLITQNFRNLKILLTLSIATSIDAFAVGISLGLIEMPLFVSIGMIGIITFILSFFGYMAGRKLGSKSEFFAGLIGGVILLVIAVKIALIP